MPRKVFISFLGTNDYLETHYSFNNVVSKPVRFIQEAAIEHFCSEWTSEDAIYIFVTEKSRRMNWQDDGHPGEDPKKGLQKCISELNLDVPVYDVDIPEGFDEYEIWELFNTIYDKLQKGDELFIDVTHAFRSIPLFSTVLFNYSRFMKGVHVSSIVYGAFEKLGSVRDVMKTPVELRVAPVINLTGLIQLQQHTEIASGLDYYGRVNKDELDWFKKSSVGRAYHKDIEQICGALADFDEAMTTNNMVAIKEGKFYHSFISAFRNISENYTSVLPIPMMKVLERLEEQMSGFEETESWKNVETAVSWATKYQMLPLAYTLAREYLATRIADNLIGYKKASLSEKDFKETISKTCAINDKNVQFGNVSQDLVKNGFYDLIDLPLIQKIRKSGHYNSIAKGRNSLNHGVVKITYSDLISQFKSHYQGCLAIINNFE